MSGYDIRRLPFLTDLNGRLVGVISSNGQEVFFPTFTQDQLSLLKPDGSVLAGQGGGPTYILPPATTSTLGGIKVGSGLAVAADGTVMVTAGGGGSSYTLPAATTTTLGGIKVGSNLTVGTDGTLNASASSGGSGSVRVVYTSSTCTSDADLSLGSTNTGTDQRAKLQTLLDLALNGPLLLIVDGAYGVSPDPVITDTALRVNSNTIISALPGCGFILRGTAQSSLLSNADRNDGRTGNSANGAGNKNIQLFGLTLNGANMTPSILQIFGIDGLVMRDLRLLNSNSFHWHIGNWKNVNASNIYVNKLNGSTYSDGLHFCGPGQYLSLIGVTAIGCGDDSVALNADDNWVGNTKAFQPYGDITDVVIHDVKLSANAFGIRILSGGSRVDRISISKVRGSTQSYWLVIENSNPAATIKTGPGNIGSVTIDDVDVDVTALGARPIACAIIDCKIERLTMTKIKRSTFLSGTYASIEFDSKADIGQLCIDGYEGYPYKAGTALSSQINFLSGAKVAQGRIANSMFNAPSSSGYPITVQSGATIGALVVFGNQGNNFTDFLSNAGTISSLSAPAASNFMTAAAVSTWVLQNNGSFTEDTSKPSQLTYTGPTPNVVSSAKKSTVDAFGGNIKLSCRVNMSGTAEPGMTSAIFVRGANSVPLANISAGTILSLTASSSNQGARLNTIGGADARVLSTAIVPGVDYDVVLITKTVSGTTTESASVQRVSDGLYLTTGGVFASGAQNCFSRTNANAAAAGEYGVYAYDQSTSTVLFTNFTAVAAP